jgi:DNA-directed RNA polymerase I, II, and III subunit RPABC2
MDFENEPENIDEYYSNDEDENYEESDTESETETNKKPKITIGGALSDDEDEDEEAEVIEKDENDEEEVEDEEVEESDEENEDEEQSQTATKEKKVKKVLPPIVNSDDEDEGEEDDEGYLQKFDKEINNNYILNIHPECKTHNYDEIACLSKVVYNADGIIVDPLHRTIPILTKYERTRVLGQRAKQINAGSKPFVKVPENIIDGYLIAEIELSQKRIPFIIRRPFPGGGCEYWNIKDLELID